MKKLRIFSICIYLILTLFFCACGDNVKSDETYRNQYTVAYKSASDALGKSQNSVYATIAPEKNAFRDRYKLSNGDTEKGTRAYVYFIYLLYKNNIPITENPVKFDCDYKVNGTVVQKNTITLLSKVDLERGKITGDVIGVSEEKGVSRDTDEFYIHIEIDFDFDTLSIGDFSLDIIGITDNGLSFENGFSCLYENKKLYRAAKSDFGNALNDYVEFVENAYYRPYESLTENAIKLKRNFSAEYTESINKIAR